jgi:hypothetical protein
MKDSTFEAGVNRLAFEKFLMETLEPRDYLTARMLLKAVRADEHRENVRHMALLKWLSNMASTYKSRSETFLELLKRVIEKSQGEICAEVRELRNFIEEQIVPETKVEDYLEETEREIREVGSKALDEFKQRLRM